MVQTKNDEVYFAKEGAKEGGGRIIIMVVKVSEGVRQVGHLLELVKLLEHSVQLSRTLQM